MTFIVTRIWLLVGFCFPLLLGAQDIDLPQVQSQYLHQAENSSAPILRVQYDQNKAQLYGSEGWVAFLPRKCDTITGRSKPYPRPYKALTSSECALTCPC